jgi:hypothetical protein
VPNNAKSKDFRGQSVGLRTLPSAIVGHIESTKAAPHIRLQYWHVVNNAASPVQQLDSYNRINLQLARHYKRGIFSSISFQNTKISTCIYKNNE